MYGEESIPEETKIDFNTELVSINVATDTDGQQILNIEKYNGTNGKILVTYTNRETGKTDLYLTDFKESM